MTQSIELEVVLRTEIKRLTARVERLWADAKRYRYLRARPAHVIGTGGVFAGMTPKGGQGGYILTEEHLDAAIDAALEPKP